MNNSKPTFTSAELVATAKAIDQYRAQTAAQEQAEIENGIRSKLYLNIHTWFPNEFLKELYLIEPVTFTWSGSGDRRSVSASLGFTWQDFTGEFITCEIYASRNANPNKFSMRLPGIRSYNPEYWKDYIVLPVENTGGSWYTGVTARALDESDQYKLGEMLKTAIVYQQRRRADANQIEIDFHTRTVERDCEPLAEIWDEETASDFVNKLLEKYTDAEDQTIVLNAAEHQAKRIARNEDEISKKLEFDKVYNEEMEKLRAVAAEKFHPFFIYLVTYGFTDGPDESFTKVEYCTTGFPIEGDWWYKVSYGKYSKVRLINVISVEEIEVKDPTQVPYGLLNQTRYLSKVNNLAEVISYDIPDFLCPIDN